mgnify:CR=1 FL=1
MRVTERMRVSGAASTQSKLAARFDKATRVAARGERVSVPSDDPIAYAARARSDHALSLNEKRSELATKVSGELEVAEGALSAGVDLLSEARAAAMAGANDSLDAGARSLMAQQVTALRAQLLDIANTRYGSKFLFAGTRTDVAPFDSSGAFVGNDVVTRVSLMEGITPPANVSGARAFTSAGGRDVLADLQSLADALSTNDVAGVRASIDTIDASHGQLVRVQTEAGLSTERFRSAIDVMASTKIVVAKARAEEVEGDPLAQLTELSLAKSAYERGVGVTRELLSVSSLARQ